MCGRRWHGGGQAVAPPAIGGIITDTLGWRWLFWINIPLAVAAMAVVRAVTPPESRDATGSRRVDWLGLATIGLAVFALLFALTDGPTAGWGSPPLVVGLLIATVALGVAWVLVERHVREPLVDLTLFRLRPYDGALAANLTMNLAYAGLSYLLVLWLQTRAATARSRRDCSCCLRPSASSPAFRSAAGSTPAGVAGCPC